MDRKQFANLELLAGHGAWAVGRCVTHPLLHNRLQGTALSGRRLRTLTRSSSFGLPVPAQARPPNPAGRNLTLDTNPEDKTVLR